MKQIFLIFDIDKGGFVAKQELVIEGRVKLTCIIKDSLVFGDYNSALGFIEILLKSQTKNVYQIVGIYTNLNLGV